jgi:hypothetical protein
LAQSGLKGGFSLAPEWTKLAGCDAATLPAIVAALGYRMVRASQTEGAAPVFVARRKHRTAIAATDDASPFAALAALGKP